MQSNKMISKFSGKPKIDAYYRAIDGYVMGLGEIKGSFVSRSTIQSIESSSGYEHTRESPMECFTSM